MRASAWGRLDGVFESSAGTVGGRAVLAICVGGLMVAVASGVSAWVDNYAVHLCRWPATISCSDGWAGWQLAPVWFWLFVVVGIAALARFVVDGLEAAHLTPIVVLIIGFPILVLATGPRRLGVGDLFVFAAYGTYALFLAWQTLSVWWPRGRMVLGIAAVLAVVAQLTVIAMTPAALGDVAEQNGLTRSPLY